MGQIVSIPRTRTAETSPIMHRVRRSPRQDAIGGVILSIYKSFVLTGFLLLEMEDVPGSREYLLHIKTREHMNEPSTTLLIEADAIDEVNSTINLRILLRDAPHLERDISLFKTRFWSYGNRYNIITNITSSPCNRIGLATREDYA